MISLAWVTCFDVRSLLKDHPARRLVLSGVRIEDDGVVLVNAHAKEPGGEEGGGGGGGFRASMPRTHDCTRTAAMYIATRSSNGVSNQPGRTAVLSRAAVWIFTAASYLRTYPSTCLPKSSTGWWWRTSACRRT